MKILIASDHAGLDLKTHLVNFLKTIKALEVEDFGPFDKESVDYPDFADKVCKKLAPGSKLLDQPSELGILICGSGQGMAIRANRHPHIRAALCWNVEIAQLSREHNDANVLCLGSRFISPEDGLKIVQTFLKTPFAQGRHLRRVVKLSKMT